MVPYKYVPIDVQTGSDAIKYNVSKKPVFYSQYYSGCDASLYLCRGDNNLLLAEGKALASELNEKVMPLYGYASYTPDRWARGTRIVAGMFTVNMLGVNYLFDYIGNVLDQQYKNLANQQNASAANSGNDEKEQYKWKYWNTPVKYDKLDNKLNYNLSDKPFFRKQPFSLVTAYKVNTLSTIDKSILNHLQSIDDVYITSVTMQLDTSGRPLEQTYSFLAGDLNRVQWT